MIRNLFRNLVLHQLPSFDASLSVNNLLMLGVSRLELPNAHCQIVTIKFVKTYAHRNGNPYYSIRIKRGG
jgi:hypothetical protein